MQKLLILLFVLLTSSSCKRIFKEHEQPIAKNFTFLVNGKPFMINGMNWDYFPVGTNYDYSLWEQDDAFIKSALDYEMALLEEMGVNAIRQYTGVPARWIRYIYNEYGIYTMLNHPLGRYGYQLDGIQISRTDYSDETARKILLDEIRALAKKYRNTDGLLLYLLGNENNYGLFWEGGETENIPENDPVVAKQAKAMYQLFNLAAREIKKIDSTHKVAICNGDLLFLELISRECSDIDIYGTNMYRGKSFTNAFERVSEEYGKPILFTEFGSDAYNVRTNSEDQDAQAYYLLENWKEIYENVAGLEKTGNSIGGFTFQFSDGWWKYGQTRNLDIHDKNASWSNAGYSNDYQVGSNNMNEEWFGVCAKEPSAENEVYTLNPRLAYYVLKEIHQLDPYSKNMSQDVIDDYFRDIRRGLEEIKMK